MRTRSRASAAERVTARDPARAPPGRRVIQKDQVDIARIVQLLPAELADAEHDQPAALLRIGRVERGRSRRSPPRPQQMAQRGAEGGFGEAAQRRHLAFERPGPASSATAARSATRRLAIRSRRISCARSSPLLRGYSTSATISSNGGSSPCRSAGSGNPIRRPRSALRTDCCRRARRAACRLPACRSRRGRAAPFPRLGKRRAPRRQAQFEKPGIGGVRKKVSPVGGRISGDIR